MRSSNLLAISTRLAVLILLVSFSTLISTTSALIRVFSKTGNVTLDLATESYILAEKPLPHPQYGSLIHIKNMTSDCQLLSPEITDLEWRRIMDSTSFIDIFLLVDWQLASASGCDSYAQLAQEASAFMPTTLFNNTAAVDELTVEALVIISDDAKYGPGDLSYQAKDQDAPRGNPPIQVQFLSSVNYNVMNNYIAGATVSNVSIQWESSPWDTIWRSSTILFLYITLVVLIAFSALVNLYRLVSQWKRTDHRPRPVPFLLLTFACIFLALSDQQSVVARLSELFMAFSGRAVMLVWHLLMIEWSLAVNRLLDDNDKVQFHDWFMRLLKLLDVAIYFSCLLNLVNLFFDAVFYHLPRSSAAASSEVAWRIILFSNVTMVCIVILLFSVKLLLVNLLTRQEKDDNAHGFSRLTLNCVFLGTVVFLSMLFPHLIVTLESVQTVAGDPSVGSAIMLTGDVLRSVAMVIAMFLVPVTRARHDAQDRELPVEKWLVKEFKRLADYRNVRKERSRGLTLTVWSTDSTNVTEKDIAYHWEPIPSPIGKRFSMEEVWGRKLSDAVKTRTITQLTDLEERYQQLISEGNSKHVAGTRISLASSIQRELDRRYT